MLLVADRTLPAMCDDLAVPWRLPDAIAESRVEPIREAAGREAAGPPAWLPAVLLARRLPAALLAAWLDRVEWMLLWPERDNIDKTLLAPAARLCALWPLWPPPLMAEESRVEPNEEAALLLPLLPALLSTLPMWLPPPPLTPDLCERALAMLGTTSSPGPARISEVCDW